MEHGEKLAAMIQLRELQIMISQNHSGVTESANATSDSGIPGSLWHLIQLVGERAQWNTVLMDRDNAEVFYSKVSEIEEVFNCLDKQLELLVSEQNPLTVRAQRVNELSRRACVTLIRAAIEYKNEHGIWYPSSEGLTPWFCQLVVRKGLWQLASCMLPLLKGVNGLDQPSKADLFSHLVVLSEVLLESYSGAIATKIDRREDYWGLTNEYWSRRDLLLESLYEHIKTSVQAKSVEVMEGTGEQNELLRECSGLLPNAKRHEGYLTLWNICSDLDDSGLLRNLMEVITKLIDDDEEMEMPGEQMIRPEDLIKLCLKGQNPELTLQVFDVFAYMGSSFRRSNRSLLEECWKNVADQDDWGKLYRSSVTEGWTDADTLKVLRKTILFQASSRCYGPEAEIIEGGFEEVMTLREETAEDSILRDPVPSVESILMQHKVFPEAGKLILMAIVLGSAEIEIREEGPLPME